MTNLKNKAMGANPIIQPWLAVDCILFDKSNRLLLIQRKNPPFQGQYALPGGFVKIGETTEHAALRELQEETDVVAAEPLLVGVYSDPQRDPRHHVISIAYLVKSSDAQPKAGDDAVSAQFVADWDRLSLAFDHNKILADALKLRANPAAGF